VLVSYEKDHRHQSTGTKTSKNNSKNCIQIVTTVPQMKHLDNCTRRTTTTTTTTTSWSYLPIGISIDVHEVFCSLMAQEQELQASDEEMGDMNSSHFCVESWKRLFSKPDLLQTGCNEGYSQWKDMKNGIQFNENHNSNHRNANCNNKKKNPLHSNAHEYDENLLEGSSSSIYNNQLMMRERTSESL
jgi:hypothetical protein